MAEPFGIAASALQVAGAGLKLAETLKAYTDSVRKAEKQLKPVADHVKLTANVLNNVGSLLKNEDIRGLYTKELLGSTNNALGGCRTAFEDLEKFISKLLKPGDGPSGKVSIQMSAKFTLYFKQKELDVLQAHLERFKSSLDLVLGVLNLASSARSVKDTSVIASMKADIQRLIQAEHVAKMKEASLIDPPSAETNEVTDSARSITTQGLPSTSSTAQSPPATVPIMNAFAVPGTTSRGIDPSATNGSSVAMYFERSASPEDTVLQYLTKCADAAAQLTNDIERAISNFNSSDEAKIGDLEHALQFIHNAQHGLKLFELKKVKSKGPPPPYIERSKGHGLSQQGSAGANYTERNYVQSSQIGTPTSCHHRPRSPIIIRRRSRSSSSEGRRRRQRSSDIRPRSRSIAERRSYTTVAARSYYTLNARNNQEIMVIQDDSPTRRSKSRRGASSQDSSRDSAVNEPYRHQELALRTQRFAQAGLAAAAVAGILERARSRSRDVEQNRSRSRHRQDIPVAAAGLGGAALAGLYEKKCKAKGASDSPNSRIESKPDPSGVVKSPQSARIPTEPGSNNDRQMASDPDTTRHRTLSSYLEISSHEDRASSLMRMSLVHNPLALVPHLSFEYPTDSLEFDDSTEHEMDGKQQQKNYFGTSNSPDISPRLTPQETALPHFTTEDNFGMNSSMNVWPSPQMQNAEVYTNQDTFPPLDHAGVSIDMGNADEMSPPDISIDFSPAAAQSRDGQENATTGSDSASNASDQRDYILNLAEPERSPAPESSDNVVHKHPATFQCTLCSKRFTRAYNLRAHLRTHTEERPFTCTVCGKAFARQYERRRHESIHNSDKAPSEQEFLPEFVDLTAPIQDSTVENRLPEFDSLADGLDDENANHQIETLSPVQQLLDVDHLLREWTTLAI